MVQSECLNGRVTSFDLEQFYAPFTKDCMCTDLVLCNLCVFTSSISQSWGAGSYVDLIAHPLLFSLSIHTLGTAETANWGCQAKFVKI